MTCVRCDRDNEADSTFCRHCGASLRSGPETSGPAVSPRLARLPDKGQIAGVCAGIAAYFKVDVTVVRLLWVILSIVPGGIIGGLIAYGAAWLLMPESIAPADHAVGVKRLTRSWTDRKIAGVCGGISEYLGVDATLVRVAAVILAIYPGAIICGLIAYGIGWLLMPQGPPSQFEHAVA